MANFKHPVSNLLVDGFVNDLKKSLHLDTGATKTILQSDVLTRTVEVEPTRWRLFTTMGGSAEIRGKDKIKLRIGNTPIKQQALEADIDNKVIVGMNIMDTNRLQLDLKRGGF